MPFLRDPGFVIPSASEITTRTAYEGRRDMLKLLGSGVAGAAMASWAARDAQAQTARASKLAPLASTRSAIAGGVTMEKPTPYVDATGYNNFYEFGTDKGDPAQNAHTLKTRPWTVAIEGAVKAAYPTHDGF